MVGVSVMVGVALGSRVPVAGTGVSVEVAVIVGVSRGGARRMAIQPRQ